MDARTELLNRYMGADLMINGKYYMLVAVHDGMAIFEGEGEDLYRMSPEKALSRLQGK